MAGVSKYSLAATGTTGNNTHASLSAADHENAQLGFQFVVEAAGTTVTWKIQGSLDVPGLSDAAGNWYDIPYVTDASDTVATTALTSTAVGAKVIYLDQGSGNRCFRSFRLVTSSNTGITYRGEFYVFAGNAGN